MEHADSKYALAYFRSQACSPDQFLFHPAQRGPAAERQGPLVEYQNQEKPLSIAFREINDGLLEETLGEDDLTEGN